VPQVGSEWQVGDASASASPLSFGGFGSMVRHLGRLTTGLDDALQQDALSLEKLKLLQASYHFSPATTRAKGACGLPGVERGRGGGGPVAAQPFIT